MNGPEHYRAAERILGNAEKAAGEGSRGALTEFMVAAAQVHATLALAAATAYPATKDYDGDEDGRRSTGWAGVA